MADTLQIAEALPSDWLVVPQNAIPVRSLPQFLPVPARDKIHSIGATSFRKIDGEEVLVSGGVVVALLKEPIELPTAEQQKVQIAAEGPDVVEVEMIDSPVPGTLAWTIPIGNRQDDVIQFIVNGQIVVVADMGYESATPPELSAAQLARVIHEEIEAQLADAPPQ